MLQGRRKGVRRTFALAQVEGSGLLCVRVDRFEDADLQMRWWGEELPTGIEQFSLTALGGDATMQSGEHTKPSPQRYDIADDSSAHEGQAFMAGREQRRVPKRKASSARPDNDRTHVRANMDGITDCSAAFECLDCYSLGIYDLAEDPDVRYFLHEAGKIHPS